MSNNLHPFLTSLGAKQTQDSHCEFPGNNTCVSSNIISPLTHYGVLSITGPDTATFLQGQTTCNITQVTDQRSLPGAYCTAKGRLVSNFRICCSDQHTYLLRMRRQIVSNTQAVLGKYIVFSKAQQQDASDEFIIIGLYGDQVKKNLAKIFKNIPILQNDSVVENGNIAIQLDEAGHRYECWIKGNDIKQLWPQLSHGLTTVGSPTWEQLTISLGLADINQQTIETFVPQMLNYHLTGEISFNKGCYTGQEVVARMHYRGKLKRQTYRIAIASPPPTPGTPLYINNTTQSIGNIVNSIATDKTSSEALAVITIDAAENNADIITADNTPIKLLSLPYAISNRDS